MELSNTLCQSWSRNRQRKLSHCRTRNHFWKLSHGWRMESTAQPTHKIDTKNRFMANAWNCQPLSANVDPEVISKSSVTVEREIIFENWVMLNGWNRQWILIHDFQMKSIEKTQSSLTNGIVCENCVTRDQKSSAKTESMQTLKSQLKSEWQLTYGIDSTTYASNRYQK